MKEWALEELLSYAPLQVLVLRRDTEGCAMAYEITLGDENMEFLGTPFLVGDIDEIKRCLKEMSQGELA